MYAISWAPLVGLKNEFVLENATSGLLLRPKLTEALHPLRVLRVTKARVRIKPGKTGASWPTSEVPD